MVKEEQEGYDPPPPGAMRQSSVEQVSYREMECRENQYRVCTVKRGRDRDVRSLI